MTTRTRTRARPGRTDDQTEQRTGGATTSETDETKHSKTKTMELVQMPGGLIARITIRDGITLNMGDYNSFRRDVGLELDVPLPDTDDPLTMDGQMDPDLAGRLDLMADKMSDWVADRLDTAMDDAQDMLGG